MADRDPFGSPNFRNTRNILISRHAKSQPVPADLTLYPNQWTYEGYKWGMTIDLNTCTGCSACIIACQAENNIAVVGKDQVDRGPAYALDSRGSLLRGQLGHAGMYNQPVPCMHCENAPCEVGLSGSGDRAQRGRSQPDGL